MKVTVEGDCTPAEARQFFGLPDVEPLQRKVMAEVERRTMAELDRFSPDNLLKTWLTLAPGSAAQMQEVFGKLFQPGFGLAPECFEERQGGGGQGKGGEQKGAGSPAAPKSSQ